MPDTSEASCPQTGTTFKNTVLHIRQQQKTWDITADARTWLISSAEKMVTKLKTELKTLQENATTPLKIPRYVVDPTNPLMLLTENIPGVLLAYKSQFIIFLEAVFRSHGLDVRCVWIEYTDNTSRISASIRFPEEYTAEKFTLNDLGEAEDLMFISRLAMRLTIQ